MNNEKITCAWCGDISHVEWIHGRGQCSSCKVILDEDYRGNGESYSKKTAANNNSMNAVNITMINKYYKSVLKYFLIPI